MNYQLLSNSSCKSMVSRFHILKLLFLLFIYFDEFLVDMFFLKTCSFNGVKPRLFEQHYYEGLFCLGTPTARFSIVPCDRSACDCCHSPCHVNKIHQLFHLEFLIFIGSLINMKLFLIVQQYVYIYIFRSI